MADAQAVIKEVIEELLALETASRRGVDDMETLDAMSPLIDLAHQAVHSTDGGVPDVDVIASGLSVERLTRLGLGH